MELKSFIHFKNIQYLFEKQINIKKILNIFKMKFLGLYFYNNIIKKWRN